jgi:hypothetical protein
VYYSASTFGSENSGIFLVGFFKTPIKDETVVLIFLLVAVPLLGNLADRACRFVGGPGARCLIFQRRRLQRHRPDAVHRRRQQVVARVWELLERDSTRPSRSFDGQAAQQKQICRPGHEVGLMNVSFFDPDSARLITPQTTQTQGRDRGIFTLQARPVLLSVHKLG